MSIGEICVRNVVCAGRDATVMEAAALMREHHVGGVIIVDPAQDGRIPVGIVTDRDIVVETVAAGVDPQSVRVGDLLKRPIATVTEDMGYAETISKMSVAGVRRMPVVDHRGLLVGIIALDDLLRQLASPLAAVSELAGRGRHYETQTRR